MSEYYFQHNVLVEDSNIYSIQELSIIKMESNNGECYFYVRR